MRETGGRGQGQLSFPLRPSNRHFATLARDVVPRMYTVRRSPRKCRKPPASSDSVAVRLPTFHQSAMKINDLTAPQQDRPLPEEQVIAAPLVTRENPAGGAELQSLADLSASRRRSRDDVPSHRRSASHSGDFLNAGLPAPALHDIIGRQRVSELDADFGSRQPVLNLATDGIKSWEREGGTWSGQPLMHPQRFIFPGEAPGMLELTPENLGDRLDLDGIRRGEKKYMWTVSALGRLLIGEELPAGKDPETGEQRYLGHPTLVGGGPSRISGELRYNQATGKFVISNRSGRYSRYEDRPGAGLEKVAGMFAQLGLEVETEMMAKYITRKVPAKLVLPSLDPRRSGAAADSALAPTSGAALAPAEAMTGHRARDPVNEPAPTHHEGDGVREGRNVHPSAGHAQSDTLRRSLSVGDPRGDPTAPTLPFEDLVGKDRAEQLNREWGTLQGARVKNGRPHIHAWEEGLHPDRVVVPVDNPQNCDLKSMIDLEAIKAGTPMLWSVGMGAPLILGPHTLLPDPDPETGKERRLGHPALVAGEKDPESGEWVWGKLARVSGELRWDTRSQRFYIINQSGRYSRHPDRGMDQMINVAEHFEKSGLPVEIRLVER